MTDTLHASIVTDHAFEPKGDWYTLCKRCNLGEAAHRATTMKKEVDLTIPYRCVDCVTKEVDPCPHGRPGTLQSDASARDWPRWSGSICLECGGEMVRTGNCETCTSCGSTSGCG